MSLCRIHLKKLVRQATNQTLCSFQRHFGYSSQWFRVANPQLWSPMACEKPQVLVAGVRQYSYSDKPSEQPKKKKKTSITKSVLGNVGELIPHKVIQVIDENGEDMGQMFKNNVIQIMKERDLKLVALKEEANPPVYRLMTGKQLFEEQSKQREMQKSLPVCFSSRSGLLGYKTDQRGESGRFKVLGVVFPPSVGGTSLISAVLDKTSGKRVTGNIQIKEMSFAAHIAEHDLDIKKKQLLQWIEKKYHIQITIYNSRTEAGPAKEDVMQAILKSFEEQASCVSKPQLKKNAMFCVLRPISEKELQNLKKERAQKRPEDKEVNINAERIGKEKSIPEQSPNTEITKS